MFDHLVALNYRSPWFYKDLIIFSVNVGMLIGNGALPITQVIQFYINFIKQIDMQAKGN